MNNKRRVSLEEQKRRKNERAKQYYFENKEKISAYHKAHHQKMKEIDHEYMARGREKARQFRLKNPEYIKEQNAKRRKEKAEETKQYNREWFARNKDKRSAYQQNRRKRAISAGGKLSRDIQHKLMVLQKGKCACCQRDLSKAVINLDHVMPLALGGAHSDDNMQLLCQTCNNQKYCKHPIDFMQEKGFLL